MKNYTATIRTAAGSKMLIHIQQPNINKALMAVLKLFLFEDRIQTTFVSISEDK